MLRTWFGRFAGRADVTFVVEEMVAAGITPHLAEPADTATQRGRKKRAKTDRADARLQRELLCQGRLSAPLGCGGRNRPRLCANRRRRTATVTGAEAVLEPMVVSYGRWLARYEPPHLKQIERIANMK